MFRCTSRRLNCWSFDFLLFFHGDTPAFIRVLISRRRDSSTPDTQYLDAIYSSFALLEMTPNHTLQLVETTHLHHSNQRSGSIPQETARER